MTKLILIIVLISAWIWYFFAYNSSYIPISKQIDLKTMSLKKPDFIVFKRDVCYWTCRNFSSSSSYWWAWSFWGK
jgi:hypothetical protein